MLNSHRNNTDKNNKNYKNSIYYNTKNYKKIAKQIMVSPISFTKLNVNNISNNSDEKDYNANKSLLDAEIDREFNNLVKSLRKHKSVKTKEAKNKNVKNNNMRNRKRVGTGKNLKGRKKKMKKTKKNYDNKKLKQKNK